MIEINEIGDLRLSVPMTSLKMEKRYMKSYAIHLISVIISPGSIIHILKYGNIASLMLSIIEINKNLRTVLNTKQIISGNGMRKIFQ